MDAKSYTGFHWSRCAPLSYAGGSRRDRVTGRAERNFKPLLLQKVPDSVVTAISSMAPLCAMCQWLYVLRAERTQSHSPSSSMRLALSTRRTRAPSGAGRRRRRLRIRSDSFRLLPAASPASPDHHPTPPAYTAKKLHSTTAKGMSAVQSRIDAHVKRIDPKKVREDSGGLESSSNLRI